MKRTYKLNFEHLSDNPKILGGVGGFNPNSDHSDGYLDSSGGNYHDSGPHVDGHMDMHLLDDGTEVSNPDPTVYGRLAVLEVRIQRLEAQLLARKET